MGASDGRLDAIRMRRSVRRYRPRRDGTDAEHADWAAGHAETELGTYRDLPVWIAALSVPRFRFPDDPMKQRIEMPVGHPAECPVGLRPKVAKARRPRRMLVHDEGWGRARRPEPEPAPLPAA